MTRAGAVARFALAGWAAGTFAFFGFASGDFHERAIHADAVTTEERIRLVLLVVAGVVVALGFARTAWRRGEDALVAASHRAFLLVPLGLLPFYQTLTTLPARFACIVVVTALFGWGLFQIAYRSPWGAAFDAFDGRASAARSGAVIAVVLASFNAWVVGRFAVEKCHMLWGGWDLMIHNSLHFNIVTTGRAWTTGLMPFPVDHYGNHFAPIEHLSAIVYWFHRTPETLVVIQAIMINAAACAVYGIARRLTKSALAGVLLAASWGFNACIVAPCLYDFHEAAFLLPTLLGLFWACVARKNRLIVLFAALALNSREDAGLWVALFGFVWWTRGNAVGKKLAAVGASWLVLVNFFVMPAIRASTGQPVWLQDRYSAIARGGRLGVVHTALSVVEDPGFVASYVFANADKWIFLALLLLPVACLPLRTRRGVLLVGPPIAFSVLSVYPPMYTIDFHYTVQILPFLYFAAILGLETFERRTAIVLAASALVATVLVSGWWSRHPVINARFVDAERELLRADYGDRAEKYRRIALDVPGDDCAQGSGPLATPLSSRRFAYLVPEGPNCKYGFIDYSKNARQSPGATTAKMRRWVVEKLRAGYGIRYADDRVILVERGGPTDRNAELIARISALAMSEDGDSL